MTWRIWFLVLVVGTVVAVGSVWVAGCMMDPETKSAG
jgi:hypothetical protein